jgi:hypothetical protein
MAFLFSFFLTMTVTHSTMSKIMPLPAFTIQRENFSQEDIENFWRKIDKRGPNECWPWKYMISGDGYGRLTFKKKDLIAHRVAYTITKGVIPDGMQINHICCSRSCCNPNHLEVVTCKENLQYASKLGRMATGERHGSYTRPESVTRGDKHWTRSNPESIQNYLKGENNPDSRLTNAQVIEIRSLYATGQHTQKELAKRFGIGQTAISSIV